MYWTHLIFALTIGLFVYDDPIIAVKAGYLDFDNLPETNFSCKDKVIGGYYADVETGCQMFHVCTIGQKGEVTDIKFLCLNGTVFDQETRVCERIDEVDCSKSEDFFNLNLELYGNQAGGIQPEEEFFCEDCSTEEDDYADITTRPTSTTTTTTTTTTRPTTTTTTTRPTTLTPKVAPHYQTSNPETIAALIALHNAFSQSVSNPKVKPPPPRVINNAFAGVTPSTPRSTYFGRPQVTQLPPRDDGQYEEETDRPRQTHRLAPQDHRAAQQDHRVAQQDQRVLQQDHRVAQQDLRVAQQDQRILQQDQRIAQQDQRILQQDHRIAQQDHRIVQQDPRDQFTQTHHGNLHPPNHHKATYYQVTTPTNLRANYHHFQSGDSGFVHSFDTGKQYNYQYFQHRKPPEPTAKASVSIVTSTSTSTSVRASKNNDTVDDVSAPGDDFPTGYDDYPDDSIDDAFFRDVPKIRTKRSGFRHANHRYPGDVLETTTQRHRNHRYDWPDPSPPTTQTPGKPEPTVAGGSGRSPGRTRESRTGRNVSEPLVPRPPTAKSEALTGPSAGALPEEETPTRREAFLQNLLGSLDMDEHFRQKMAHFFKIEEKEVDQSAGLLHQMGNKLGELIMDDINKTIHQAQMEEMKQNSTERQLDMNKIDEMWRHHYQEMSQEVDLKFDLGSERDRNRRDANKKLMEELAQDYELVKAKIENVPIPKVDKLEKVDKEEIKQIEKEENVGEKPRIKRQAKGLDTEKFTASHHEPRKRLRARPEPPLSTEPVTRDVATLIREPPLSREAVPVFEEVDEGDFTTRPYLRLDRTQRPRLTTRSVDRTVRLRFNYEMTTPSTPVVLKNRPNSRSVTGESNVPSYGSLPLLTPPSVTRDVSKLKDTPVYEEVDFTDPGPGQGPGPVQGVQTYRPAAPLVMHERSGLAAAEEATSQTEVTSQLEASRPRRPLIRRTRPLSEGASARSVQVDERLLSRSRSQEDRIQPRTRSQANSPTSRSRSQGDTLVSRTRQEETLRSQGDSGSTSWQERPPRTRTQERPKTISGRQRVRQDPKARPSQDGDESETANYPRDFRQPSKAPSHVDPDETANPETENYPRTPASANFAQTPAPAPPQHLSPANPPEPQQPFQVETQQPRNYPQEKITEARVERVQSRNRGSVRDRDFDFTPEDEAPTLAPKRARVVSRGKVRGTLRSTTPPNEPPPPPPMDPSLVPDPDFSCEGKIKGSFYADVSNDCKGFFICSQGQINGPLLKSHFWCGTNTKFNQRSRTCQDETLVECSVSSRYYHLNQDFAIPETEEQLKPAFEPLRDRTRG